MSKSVWTGIPDNRVQHVWTQAEDDDCGEGEAFVMVSPDWYEQNGTPICNCGRDMVYHHTEILLPEGISNCLLEKVE